MFTIGRNAVRGYQRASPAERSAFGMSIGFATSVAISRAINYVRERNRPGPRTRSRLRRVASALRPQEARVHHFLPGIGIAYTVAVAAIAARGDGRETWLAPVFGAGAGLTLDEFGLLLELDNPYWESEQAALTAASAAGLVALALGVRFALCGDDDEKSSAATTGSLAATDSRTQVTATT